MDDYPPILVDGTKSIPMAVWVTHPLLRPPTEGGDSLGTGGFRVPSVTKVIHSLLASCTAQVPARTCWISSVTCSYIWRRSCIWPVILSTAWITVV